MKVSKSIPLWVVIFLAGAVVGRVTVPKNTAAQATVPWPHPNFAAGLPDVRQSTDYSCGAAALQAVLAYWGRSEREDRLMARLRTTPEQGTSPENIVRVAREFGLEAEIREGLGLSDLEAGLRKGLTMILDLQAWPEKKDKPWAETWDEGHYVVLLDMDERNLIVEDPSLLGSRGLIPRSEFLDRWHDYEGLPPLDAKDRAFVHMAIFIKGRQPAPAPPFEAVN